MSNIIIQGGLFRIFKQEALKVGPASLGPASLGPIDPQYMAVNILLRKTNMWLNGALLIDKNPYYRILPKKDNHIEIKKLEDYHVLKVNNTIIYDTKNEFNYSVNILLNPLFADKACPEIFSYIKLIY